MISLGADPLISPLVIAIFAVGYGVLTYVMYRQFRKILAIGYWRLLLGLKALALIIALLVLVNPCLVEQQPDASAFQIACLVDATGSMQARDCDGLIQRLDVVRQRLVGESPFAQRLLAMYPNTAWFLFAGNDVRRFDGSDAFETLPGDTDIDEALQRILAGSVDRVKLGAVLVISDGLDNVGRSIVDAGPAYKAAGIPIHAIGIGDTRSRDDLGVRWVTLPLNPTKGKPFQLVAELSRNTTGTETVNVEFHEGARLIKQIPVTFQDDVQHQMVEFEHISYTAGFKTCKIRVEQLPDEENTLNNIDYAALDIAEPDVFKVLYYSDVLDWEYKFLNQLASQHEKLNLDAIIRLSQTSWYSKGIDDSKNPVKGFPDAELVHEYDALIINLRSLQLMDDKARGNLANFVERRGGGVIFTGAAEQIPAELQGLLPTNELPDLPTVARKRDTMEIRPSLLMNAWSRQEARDLSARVYLPQGAPYYRLGPQDLKPGAIAIASAGEAEWVLLAAQQYGSGKIALENIGTTWRWNMADDNGHETYGMFWSRLISWASSTLQQRLTLKPAGAKLELGAEQTMTLDILDSTYRPDNAASVGAVLTMPDGKTEQLGFIQDPRIDGRYVAKFVPRQSGEHKLLVSAALHDGEIMEERTDYVVVDRSREVEPAPLAEERLKSLARITGGKYWHYRDIDSIDELPITRQIQYVEQRHYWLGTWAFLIAAILALLPDWVARRRIGLR